MLAYAAKATDDAWAGSKSFLSYVYPIYLSLRFSSIATKLLKIIRRIVQGRENFSDM